jgi:hypothetical protein
MLLLPVAASGGDVLNIDGVTRLLDVLDAVVAEPNDSTLVDARVDTLVATTAYRLYYSKFSNMSPRQHRKIFHALPENALPGVADISSNLQELCGQRDEVRTWVDEVIARIDPQRCCAIAEQWLPPGEYRVPPTYFIYDGNGDAFTYFGNVVFDLFGLVMRHRPSATRFENLGSSGRESIERVLAHEYHHVFAASSLYGRRPSFERWQDGAKDRLIRSIVSEGVAMRCDGRPVMTRTVMEDPVVVAYWIGELERVFAALDAGTISEEELQEWERRSYHDTALGLLRDHLVRQQGPETGESLYRQNPTARPSLVYTLGWWMIAKIADQPGGQALTVELLSDPYAVIERYNAVMNEVPETLRLDVKLP